MLEKEIHIAEQYKRGIRMQDFSKVYQRSNPMIPNKHSDFFDQKFCSVKWPELYDSTHWIGIDVDYPEKIVCTDCNNIICCCDCNWHTKIVNNSNCKNINSTLKIFSVDDPSNVLSTKIHVWRKSHIDYKFIIGVRTNRIYFSDYKSLRIYDFKLNILFEILHDRNDDVDNNNPDFYGFEIDPYDWDTFWMWSVNESKNITGNFQYYSKEGLDGIMLKISL